MHLRHRVFHDPLVVRGQPAEPAGVRIPPDRDRFPAGHEIRAQCVRKHHSHAFRELVRFGGREVGFFQKHGPGDRRKLSRQCAKQRRLAGAVRADQRQDFALIYVKVEGTGDRSSFITDGQFVRR